MKPIYVLLINLVLIVPFQGCRPKVHTRNQSKVATTNKASQISIGYDSLKIYLGSKKEYVAKLLPIKWDKDNDYGSSKVGYYNPLQIIYLNGLVIGMDLYFDFNATDSALTYFSASFTFNNSERIKILPVLRKILSKKLSKISDFTDQQLSSGIENTNKYNGYEVKVRLDTSLYAPTFYYKIESVN